jgi:hypothetical protein
MYVAAGSTIRAVTRGTDELTTPVGTGLSGPLGDRGPASQAVLAGACGAAVDGSGNLLIADTTDGRICAVTGTFYGKAMTAGDIYTIAGGGTAGLGDGGSATSAVLYEPGAVALDAEANLVISDDLDNRIRMVTH